MPTYEYRCPDGHEFEMFFRKMSDATAAVAEPACPTCGKPATRKISSGAGLLFKGSGFYLTDYGKNAHRRGAGEAVPSGEPSGESSSVESKTDAKPAESPKETKTAESASTNSKSDAAKSGDAKSRGGDTKAGDAKPAAGAAAPAPKTPSGSSGPKSDK